MEYRVLLMKDIYLDNIRYSPLKKSVNNNRYSFITYLNKENEMQNIIVQCKQMCVKEISKNEKNNYSIVFEISDSSQKFIEAIDEKVKSDILKFDSHKKYRFRPSIKDCEFRCKIGHISNLVVFDQFKKMYEEENEILYVLKKENQEVVPIIECLGLWISSDNEVGITWICHHIKILPSNTLFKRYLFIDENNDKSESDESDQENEPEAYRQWRKNLPVRKHTE